jgi:hypothetical protein
VRRCNKQLLLRPSGAVSPGKSTNAGRDKGDPRVLSVSQALSKIRAGSLPRRGLSREEAAMYIGISGSTFDQMRADGLIAPPRLIGGRKLWDIRDLDMAFDALPREDAPAVTPRKGKLTPTGLTWKTY